MPAMRSLLMMISTALASAMGGSPANTSLTAAPAVQSDQRPIVDNAHVRVYRTSADALGKVPHGAAVVVSIDGRSGEIGKAVWAEDAASFAANGRHTVVVVQPREPRTSPPPPGATRPGEATFTGMSFTPIFDNDRVSVIRARMDVGAREAFHTHRADTIVVHLSGGEIEDTAGGRTVVNRWQPGDVEFEELGSSHSARNTGGAIDVVLVALKLQQH
jgi:quercetin dioxygenase-like cupin family protein